MSWHKKVLYISYISHVIKNKKHIFFKFLFKLQKAGKI